MKKLLLLLVLSLLIVPGVNAYDFSNAQKDVCKQLKKTLGAKWVEPFENAPDAPFYHFHLKNELCGIADARGNILLKPVYQDVAYFPSYNDSVLNLQAKDTNGRLTSSYMRLVTEPTAEAFWGFGEKDAEVFDRHFNRIAIFPKKNNGTYFGNYFYLGEAPYTQVYMDSPKASGSGAPTLNILTLYRKQGMAHGLLVSADGRVVIEEIDRGEFISNQPYIEYTVLTDEGVDKKGMKRLDGQGYDIPAEFYYLYSGDKGKTWNVQARSTDPYSVIYDPMTPYNTAIRDRGEAFYYNHKYDEVLEFYAKEGINAPWAKFYSAMALLHNAHNSISYFENVVKAMEAGSGLPANEGKVIGDANLVIQSLNMSKNLLNSYIAGGDQNFAKEAKWELDYADHRIETMNDYAQRYNAARGHAAQVTSQAQAQQAAMLQAILGAFSNALQGSYSGTGSTAAGHYTTAPGSVSSSVGSGTSSASEKPDYTNRKIFLKNQIIDWRKKLRRAEESLEREIASGGDDRNKQRVVESKRNTVNECLNMIRQYESELNSLK